MTENEDIVSKVTDFLDRKATVITRDRDDLKMSRSLSSGFGFSEVDDEIRGENRAKITANVLRPWINTVISSYTSNPFGIGVKRYDGNNATPINSVMDYVQSKCDFTDIAANLLESVLNDGYAYVLVTNEVDNPETNSQYPLPIILDSDRIFMDDCEEPTGADCEMAVYCSVIKKTKAEKAYGINKMALRSASDPFAKYNMVKDTTNYTTVATVYELVDDGVQVSKICHGKVVEEPVILAGMTRLPIIRISGEKVWMPSTEQWHFRGAYWFVYDLLRVINYQMSLHAERIASAPTAKLLLDSRSITGKKQEWDNINKSPLVYASYNATDEAGNPIPAPVPFPDNRDNSDLLAGVSSMTQMVSSILGAATGEPPKNETEVSVLLRKSISEATANRYIKSLCEGMEAIGDVILMWVPLLFDVERVYNNQVLEAVSDTTPYYVVVDSGPIVASQQQKTVAQLIAVDNLLAKNPASKVTPVIIKNLDIPPENKQEILQAIIPQEAPVDPAMQQMMMQKDQQLAQAQVQMTEMNKNIAMLQQSLFEMENDSRASMIENQQKIQSQERIKAMELAWEREKFIMEMQAKGLKVQVDVNEADKDRQLDAEQHTQEMMVELQKDREETRRQAQQIEVPLFTASKFS